MLNWIAKAFRKDSKKKKIDPGFSNIISAARKTFREPGKYLIPKKSLLADGKGGYSYFAAILHHSRTDEEINTLFHSAREANTIFNSMNIATESSISYMNWLRIEDIVALEISWEEMNAKLEELEYNVQDINWLLEEPEEEFNE